MIDHDDVDLVTYHQEPRGETLLSILRRRRGQGQAITNSLQNEARHPQPEDEFEHLFDVVSKLQAVPKQLPGEVHRKTEPTERQPAKSENGIVDRTLVRPTFLQKPVQRTSARSEVDDDIIESSSEDDETATRVRGSGSVAEPTPARAPPQAPRKTVPHNAESTVDAFLDMFHDPAAEVKAMQATQGQSAKKKGNGKHHGTLLDLEQVEPKGPSPQKKIPVGGRPSAGRRTVDSLLDGPAPGMKTTSPGRASRGDDLMDEMLAAQLPKEVAEAANASKQRGGANVQRSHHTSCKFGDAIVSTLELKHDEWRRAGYNPIACKVKVRQVKAKLGVVIMQGTVTDWTAAHNQYPNAPKVSAGAVVDIVISNTAHNELGLALGLEIALGCEQLMILPPACNSCSSATLLCGLLVCLAEKALAASAENGSQQPKLEGFRYPMHLTSAAGAGWDTQHPADGRRSRGPSIAPTQHIAEGSDYVEGPGKEWFVPYAMLQALQLGRTQHQHPTGGSTNGVVYGMDEEDEVDIVT